MCFGEFITECSTLTFQEDGYNWRRIFFGYFIGIDMSEQSCGYFLIFDSDFNVYLNNKVTLNILVSYGNILFLNSQPPPAKKKDTWFLYHISLQIDLWCVYFVRMWDALSFPWKRKESRFSQILPIEKLIKTQLGWAILKSSFILHCLILTLIARCLTVKLR